MLQEHQVEGLVRFHTATDTHWITYPHVWGMIEEKFINQACALDKNELFKYIFSKADAYTTYLSAYSLILQKV